MQDVPVDVLEGTKRSVRVNLESREWSFPDRLTYTVRSVVS